MRIPAPHPTSPKASGLFVAALIVLGTTLGLARLEARSAHPLYLTFGKLELEGASAVLDIRIFWDDLMLDVRRVSGDPSLQVRGPAASTEAVVSYINSHLLFAFDGQAVQGSLVEWDVDGEANRYRLRYALPSEPRELQVRHRVLLDLYEDQKNVLHVLRTGGRERAFYFARRAEEQTIRLQGR